MALVQTEHNRIKKPQLAGGGISRLFIYKRDQGFESG